jgi:hypothetical protein
VTDSSDRAKYARVLAVWGAVLAALYLFQQVFG